LKRLQSFLKQLSFSQQQSQVGWQQVGAQQVGAQQAGLQGSQQTGSQQSHLWCLKRLQSFLKQLSFSQQQSQASQQLPQEPPQQEPAATGAGAGAAGGAAAGMGSAPASQADVISRNAACMVNPPFREAHVA
jgi:hypothetical protein